MYTRNEPVAQITMPFRPTAEMQNGIVTKDEGRKGKLESPREVVFGPVAGGKSVNFARIFAKFNARIGTNRQIVSCRVFHQQLPHTIVKVTARSFASFITTVDELVMCRLTSMALRLQDWSRRSASRDLSRESLRKSQRKSHHRLTTLTAVLLGPLAVATRALSGCPSQDLSMRVQGCVGSICSDSVDPVSFILNT